MFFFFCDESKDCRDSVPLKSPKHIQVKSEPHDSSMHVKHDDRKCIRSSRSAWSRRSASSSICLAQHRLEAEETKATLPYEQKKAKVRKEQASIQVDLKVLGTERNAALTRAFENMLREEADFISFSSETVTEPVVEVENLTARTKNFVEKISLQKSKNNS